MKLHPAITNSKSITAYNRFKEVILNIKHLNIKKTIYLAPDIKIDLYCLACETYISRTPKSFYKTPNCYCKNIKRENTGKRKTTTEYIKQLKEINPQMELLDEYINKDTPINFLCKKCKQVDKYIPHNLINNQGCNNCDKKSPIVPYKEAVRRLPKISINRNQYKGYSKKTLVVFKECKHTNYKSLKDIQDYGVCNICNKRAKIDVSKPAIFYSFKIIKEGIIAYKIGITSYDLKTRYSAEELSYIKDIHIVKCKTRKEAVDLETKFLQKYKKFKYKGKPLLKIGNSELFTINPKIAKK